MQERGCGRWTGNRKSIWSGLIGEPTDPTEVWTKLENQFQKKSWANKLSMRRKLHSLRLKDGDSVQDHVKQNALSVMDAPVSEEDRVIYFLASQWQFG